jgi:pSer/pThr/pTyr-binding forkhead associated (FHA) protein
MELVLNWIEPESGEVLQIQAETPIELGRDSKGTIVLSGERISRRHAIIDVEDDRLFLQDKGSTNGTTLNGTKIDRAQVRSGDVVGIGGYQIKVQIAVVVETSDDLSATVADPAPELTLPDELKGTLFFTDDDSDLHHFIQGALAPPTDVLFPPLEFENESVSVESLKNSGFELEETTYLALGGGLGSFVWVDHLAIFGVPAGEITSIGLEPIPFARYARLCKNSQIPSHERLRSNSDSCPDNIWGWPGYAVRELWGSLKRFEVGNFVRTAWSIYAEPALAQTYTPRAGDVFDSIEREVARIGWDQIWRYGRIRAVRKTDDGRYAVAYTQTTESEGRVNKLMIGSYVHLAVGYPGVRFLRDLENYRVEQGDFESVVNAYEEHEHVYAQLMQHGGVALIRGRGIVASRIIQRLYEMRATQDNIQILHLMRSPNTEGNRYRRSRRLVKNHWEFQPFNWPKSAWGGELRNVMEDGSDDTRDQLLNEWGGTTTAERKDWQQIVSRGLAEGWYHLRFGNVDRVAPTEDGRLATVIKGGGGLEAETSLEADFIIDCTGLEAQLSASPLLHDLVSTYDLSLNPKGRLNVANDFEVRGMDNDAGRMYAAGAMTLGGPYAPVDSFLGLQYSAQRSVDALTALRAPGLQKLNGLSSLGQWLRWARGQHP